MGDAGGRVRSQRGALESQVDTQVLGVPTPFLGTVPISLWSLRGMSRAILILSAGLSPAGPLSRLDKRDTV